MPRHSLRLRAVLALLLLPVLTTGAFAQSGRVGGVVSDDGGQPIKGATVTARNPNNEAASFTATTDDRGRFTIIGLSAGRWRFVAQAPGHAAGEGEMAVRFGSPNPPMTFSLRKNGPTASAPLGSISGKDLQTQLAKADALFNQEQWDESIAAYRAIMTRTPALTVINLQIAAANRNKKDYDAAITAYNDLLTADPDNEKARVGIAATNLQKGDAVAAEDALLKAAEAPGAGRDVLFTLGDVKLARGDTTQAALWYQRAADADPSWGKPRYKLGLIARQTGDTARATQLLTEAISVDPISPEAALAKAALDELKQ